MILLNRILLLLLTLIVLFPGFSCKYTPTGYTYTDVESTVTANLDINLKDYKNESPIIIWGYVNFEFDIETDGREIFEQKVFFDDSLVQLRSQNQFLINTVNYSDGVHDLKIVVALKSGTGSLADNLNAEAIIFQRDWQVHVLNEPPKPVQITSIRPYEGRLIIEWEKYERTDFSYYRITRDYLKVYNDTLYTRNSTQLVDSIYVGGDLEIWVTVVANGRETTSEAVKYLDDYSRIRELEQTEDYKVRFSWSKCPYPSNFKKYILEKNNTIFVEKTNINDTMFVENESRFGNLDKYSLYVNGDAPFNSEITTYLGNIMPEFSIAKHISANNSIYLFLERNGYIHRLDASSMETLYFHNGYYNNSDRETTFDISSNGSYAYAARSSIIYIFNSTALNLKETISTTVFTREFFLQTSNILKLYVTDDNEIIYLGHYTSNLFHIVILDMNTRKLVEVLECPTGLPYDKKLFKISKNKKYFVLNYGLYAVDESGLVFVDGIDYNNFTFIDSGDQCLTIDSNIITIRNSNDLSIIETIPITANLRYPSIDPLTGYLGVLNVENYNYLILNLENGEKLFEIYSYPNFYILLNNMILSDNGYYLTLKNLQ